MLPLPPLVFVWGSKTFGNKTMGHQGPPPDQGMQISDDSPLADADPYADKTAGDDKPTVTVS